MKPLYDLQVISTLLLALCGCALSGCVLELHSPRRFRIGGDEPPAVSDAGNVEAELWKSVARELQADLAECRAARRDGGSP